MSVSPSTNTTDCPLRAYLMAAYAICLSASPSLTLTQCPFFRKCVAKQAMNPDLFFEFEKVSWSLCAFTVSIIVTSADILSVLRLCSLGLERIHQVANTILIANTGWRIRICIRAFY